MISFKRLSSILIVLLALLLGTTPASVQAQQISPSVSDTLTQTLLIHPVIDGNTSSSEHEYNPNYRLGDQIGRDFSVGKLTETGFVRRFKTDGKTNEDWYGWRKDVFAPINAKVLKVNHPDTTNVPGTMNRNARPGYIIFLRESDSTKVVYAHVREIQVSEGDQVEMGQIVGKVGNNGNSRNPHIHVGAWRADTALQIQVDLYAEHRYKQKSSSK
ncbi:MAG: M23 family metallopeptidase [Bacteroidota bacterium]